MNPAEGMLAGRVALVTGASRNLGAEIARTLAAAGARVVVNYHASADAARELLGTLPGAGHVAVGADAGSPPGVDQLVTESQRLTGATIDILVNNAGPFSLTPYSELQPAEFDHIWNTNARAAYLAARRTAPGMRAAGWGRIINISAGSAYLRSHSVYTLAKHAMITLTEQLALELGPEVLVNCVAPGQILESAQDMAAFDADFVARTTARTPVGRLTTRADVAGVVLALCSPVFNMVTGVTIPVDGGARLPVG